MAINPRYLSMNILAHDKVLYDGHAIAAVAATSAAYRRGSAAADRGRVRSAAAGDDGGRCDEAGRADPAAGPAQQGRGRQADQRRAALCSSSAATSTAGFKAADYVVEREFNTAMVHQGYIEPHNAVGIYNSDGQATIYCSTQGAFDVRSLSAQVLGMPVGNIKVVPAEIGGGFGGKTTIYLEPLSVLLSKKTGAPVKLVMTRAGSAARERPDLGLEDQGARWARPRTANSSPPKSGWPTKPARFRARRSARARCAIIAPYNIRQFRDRRLRRRRQSAQDRGLSRAGRDQRRVRLRDGHRRAGREVRHRSDRFPPR